MATVVVVVPYTCAVFQGHMNLQTQIAFLAMVVVLYVSPAAV